MVYVHRLLGAKERTLSLYGVHFSDLFFSPMAPINRNAKCILKQPDISLRQDVPVQLDGELGPLISQLFATGRKRGGGRKGSRRTLQSPELMRGKDMEASRASAEEEEEEKEGESKALLPREEDGDDGEEEEEEEDELTSGAEESLLTDGEDEDDEDTMETFLVAGVRRGDGKALVYHGDGDRGTGMEGE